MALFKKPKQATQGASNPPLTAYQKARLEWFERYGSAVVDRNRYSVLFGLSIVLNIGMVFALLNLTPLKTAVPYIIRTNDAGRVVSVEPATADFKPGENEIKYWISQYATQLMTLNQAMTRRNLQTVYAMSTGKAIDELNEYMRAWKPLVALNLDPSLTRDVQITTVARYNNEDVYLVRFQTEARSSGQPMVRKNWLLTIHFMQVPPKEDKDILTNPLGIYVTHWTLNEEMITTGGRTQ